MGKKTLIPFLLLLLTISGSAQPSEKVVIATDKQWYYRGETVWFSVNVFNACSNSLTDISKIVYVELVDTDHKPVYQTKLRLDEAYGHGSFSISENIVSGDYSLIAYTNWMKNFGPSAYSRKSLNVVNPAKPAAMSVSHSGAVTNGESSAGINLTVDAPKSVVAKRQAATVKISSARGARVSASVYRLDALETGLDRTIIYQPQDPCGSAMSKVRLSVPEKRGHVIMCRVLDRRTQKPAAGLRGYLSVINSPDELYVATSGSSGTMRFEVENLSGKTEIVLQTHQKNDSSYSMEIINPFIEHPASQSNGAKEDVFQTMVPVINDAMVSAQVQNIFHTRKDSAGYRQVTSEHDQGPFYGKPDAFYLMSDYVHFSTVEEILREYVTTVAVQRRNGILRPAVNDILSEKPFSEEPLVLVNGVPEFDMQRFMNMNTDEFYSMAVVARKYIYGHQVFHGIIDVRLTVPLKEFGKNATVVDYDGVAQPDTFESPKYKSEEEQADRKPDFRNVLFWSPRIDINENGEGHFTFFTSDLEGEYAVIVQAVSMDGKTAKARSIIQVR
jgi:hypothetical protein